MSGITTKYVCTSVHVPTFATLVWDEALDHVVNNPTHELAVRIVGA